MEQEFILALIVAVVVFILTLIFGEEVGHLIKFAGAAIIVVPILFYFTVGTFGMLNTDPKTAQAIADSTITNIINYVTAQLPHIIIADIAGAIVGAFGGFIVKAFSRK